MKTPETLTCGVLRIEWRSLGDRAGHKLVRCSDGTDPALLESIEAATDDARWPASPPLFDWHCEQRPEATVLLGVGLAGKSHWSVALSVERAVSDNQACLSFDVACRAGEPPSFLGSSYRVSLGATRRTETEVDLGLGCVLSVDATTARLRRNGDLLVIEPLSIAARSWPQTFRWRYMIRCASVTG